MTVRQVVTKENNHVVWPQHKKGGKRSTYQSAVVLGQIQYIQYR